MSGPRKQRILNIAGVLATLALASACGSQRMPTDPAIAVGPQLSVERFLQASNERDFVTMSHIFGTEDGPVSDTGSTFGCMFKKMASWFGGNACRKRENVELQLDAIASILRHQSYRIVTQRAVAGRSTPTTRVLVNLTMPDGSTVSEVPFDVVQGAAGQWYVERIDLDHVMTGR